MTLSATLWLSSEKYELVEVNVLEMHSLTVRHDIRIDMQWSYGKKMFRRISDNETLLNLVPAANPDKTTLCRKSKN